MTSDKFHTNRDGFQYWTPNRSAKDFTDPSWQQVISMYWVLDNHKSRIWNTIFGVNALTKCKDIIWG